ncbi:hypothetical protein REY74_09915 [Escherichia coli]|uniref:hypothetical protein n=1 Tax=Escherichia coli TaxID=562 RepID=UPI00280809D5|nr:hypothetical protein [Escherichia coli]MDQ8096762.1 hypothetical protein [Escherichia coli]
MGKSKKNRAAATKQIQLKSQTTAEAFSFGDPVPVLDRRELLDYVECVQMDRWYEPPVSFDGLARTFRAAVHHSSPIAVKCNILTSTYIPHPLLSQQAFSRFVQDYLVFGNAYLEKRTNRFGEVIALEPALAKYTRRGLDLDNVGGFGDVEKASRVFVRNELMPLQKRLQEMNDWLGKEAIRFDTYSLDIAP